MIDRFTATLTCTNRDCEFYLIPVEVDMHKEFDTGACYAWLPWEETCECGERREEAALAPRVSDWEATV